MVKNKTPVYYRQGVNARRNLKDDNKCPYGLTMLYQRGWWMAGWHDADRGLA